MPPKDEDGNGSCSLSPLIFGSLFSLQHDYIRIMMLFEAFVVVITFGSSSDARSFYAAGDAPLVIAVDCGMKSQPQTGA